MELVSPEGLRADGRRADETRATRCAVGVAPHDAADGSAALSLGNTSVVVHVHGPREPVASAGSATAASATTSTNAAAELIVELAQLPHAAGIYRPTTRGARDAVELAACVRKVFEPVVQAQLYPRSEITIVITLLQIDGGQLAACINATTLALIDAGVAMQDFVCACSVGLAQGSLLLDLTAHETGRCAELVVGMLPNEARVVCLQLESRAPLANVEGALGVASEGCRQIHEALRDCIETRTRRLLYSRGLFST